MKVLCMEKHILFRRHETLNESLSVDHPYESRSEGPQRPPKKNLIVFNFVCPTKLNETLLLKSASTCVVEHQEF